MLSLRAVLVCFCLGSLPLHAEDVAFEIKEKLVYSKVDERELLLDAFVPVTPGPHAAVLVVHGGAWRSGNRKQLAAYASALASRGMACFAIDYRLAPEHKFPAQIDDCRAAVRWIRTHAAEYRVDPDRLGAIGYSAGGHLVCLLGTTGEQARPENGNVDTRLQAVAAGGAPTDFRTLADNGKWATYWMGGDLSTVPEKFHAASAAAFADRQDPPFFFFNGTADELVPLKWSKVCHDALKEQGVRVEWHEIDGANHLQAAMNAAVLERACDFLYRELQPPQPTTERKN